MNFFENIFISKEKRIRAGWRLLLQGVLSLLLMIPFSYFFSFFANTIYHPAIALGFAATLSVWISGRILDFRNFRDFGLISDKRWWHEFVAGCLFTTLTIFLLVFLNWQLGWIEFAGFGWEHAGRKPFIVALGGYIFVMALIGFYEELWFRGYQLKNLAEGFYTGNNRNMAGLSAVALSSFIFAVLHMGNPNVTIFGVIVILLAGIMLALPYVMTGRLGFSIGVHFTWNFIQGGVFGFPVSGITFGQSILKFKLTGPVMWTGGDFGLEGGLFGILGVIFIVIVSVIYLRSRGYHRIVSEKITRYVPLNN